MIYSGTQTTNTIGRTDVAVVGGGLAGLTAATFLARAGLSVTLFEKGREVGGRAQTHTESGFNFNLGPHALYAAGCGVKTLRELNIPFSGKKVQNSGYAVFQGKLHLLPAGPRSMLSTDLLSPGEKVELAFHFATLGKMNPQSLASVSVREWLNLMFRHSRVRELFAAYSRLATYANGAEILSAGVFLSQLQLVLKESVYYLDGGWQTLVNGLQQSAQQAGVQIVTGARVTAIEHEGAVQGVRLADGAFCQTTAVVVAASPASACSLMDGGVHPLLRRWADAAVPVQASSLTIGLRRLPQPQHLFALGIDHPVYLSVHSAYAKLGPVGSSLIHVLKYLAPTAPVRPEEDERELEELLDLVQPGWRAELVERQFLPKMIVSEALVTAEQGGYLGRPAPDALPIDNLYLAGDWVGSEGLLADASLASARLAAQLILSRRGKGANERVNEAVRP